MQYPYQAVLYTVKTSDAVMSMGKYVHLADRYRIYLHDPGHIIHQPGWLDKNLDY